MNYQQVLLLESYQEVIEERKIELTGQHSLFIFPHRIGTHPAHCGLCEQFVICCNLLKTIQKLLLKSDETVDSGQQIAVYHYYSFIDSQDMQQIFRAGNVDQAIRLFYLSNSPVFIHQGPREISICQVWLILALAGEFSEENSDSMTSLNGDTTFTGLVAHNDNYELRKQIMALPNQLQR